MKKIWFSLICLFLFKLTFSQNNKSSNGDLGLWDINKRAQAFIDISGWTNGNYCLKKDTIFFNFACDPDDLIDNNIESVNSDIVLLLTDAILDSNFRNARITYDAGKTSKSWNLRNHSNKTTMDDRLTFLIKALHKAVEFDGSIDSMTSTFYISSLINFNIEPFSAGIWMFFRYYVIGQETKMDFGVMDNSGSKELWRKCFH